VTSYIGFGITLISLNIRGGKTLLITMISNVKIKVKIPVAMYLLRDLLKHIALCLHLSDINIAYTYDQNVYLPCVHVQVPSSRCTRDVDHDRFHLPHQYFNSLMD